MRKSNLDDLNHELSLEEITFSVIGSVPPIFFNRKHPIGALNRLVNEILDCRTEIFNLLRLYLR